MEARWSSEELKSTEEQLNSFINDRNCEVIDPAEAAEFFSRLYTVWQMKVRAQGSFTHSYRHLTKWMKDIAGWPVFLSGQHKLKGRLPLGKAEAVALLRALFSNWQITTDGFPVSLLGLPEDTLKEIAIDLVDLLYGNSASIVLPGDTEMFYPQYLLASAGPEVWSEIVKSMASRTAMCHAVTDQLDILEGNVNFIPLKIANRQPVSKTGATKGVYITVKIETARGYQKAQIFVAL